MRAVGVIQFGGPDALEVLDLPVPEPGPGEVRIRVHAAAVNPSDLLFRAGGGQARFLGDRPPPFVPGMDAAGVIESIGDNADGRLSVGDAVVAIVLASGAHGGAYADQIVAPAPSVVKAPHGVDFPAASTLLLNALTADLALEALDLAAGQTLGVTGASGALGGYAIQLAKARGLHVVADASPSDMDLLRALGADDVVDRGKDVSAAMRAVAPGGVDGLLDTAAQDALVVPAIADGGRLATIKGWEGPTERGVAVHPIRSTTSVSDTARLEQLVKRVEDGPLTLRVADVLPAEKAGAAHRRLEAGGVRGRLVLDFSA